MSDGENGLVNRWPLFLGVLALAVVGLWWLLEGDPEPTAPPPAEEAPAEEAEAAPPPEEPPGAEPVETDFDPDRYARMLLDGGTAAEAESAAAIYDAPVEPPARGVEEPEEVARARMEARAAEAPTEPPPREPLTPRQRLRQVTFWHGLLDQRTDAMREQIEAAEARGDHAAAARHRRILERLESQRPEMNRRLEMLQDEVAALPEEAEDSE